MSRTPHNDALKLSAIVAAHNKQLQRSKAPRWTRGRAAAELRRYTAPLAHLSGWSALHFDTDRPTHYKVQFSRVTERTLS
jgi:hypothetical protein